ncbi:Ferulic acid decarboxylase 1 [Gossypium arboreum]|uniref:Ferulic acid decarboxylase 1 n=1 Tax=Gossypium arboreum TaxID=29729 RepID=A0A0B0NR42_GOSAR|nr:Ferulic acid decarboxylase 1 [Gossypium arboreum]
MWLMHVPDMSYTSTHISRPMHVPDMSYTGSRNTCLTLAHISPALPWSNHGLIRQFIIERSYSIPVFYSLIFHFSFHAIITFMTSLIQKFKHKCQSHVHTDYTSFNRSTYTHIL